MRAGLICRLRRAAAHERGDTLIEVLVGAALLLVIAGGVVSGLTVFGHESANQRQHSQADALAQQAEGQLRGEQLSQLATLVAAGSAGSTSNVTLDGTAYTITNTASYVARTGTTSSCTASGSGNADYIKTVSTVSWNGSSALHPVQEEGVISASSGSSMVVQVLDENANPVSNITINVVGTDANTSSTNQTLTTDSSGCAVFYGLTVGTYTVSAAGPTGDGYIDTTGNANPSFNETLLAGQTTNVSFEMAQGGSLSTQFEAVAANGTQTPVSSYGGGSTAWVLQNSALTPPASAQSSSSVSGLFPFTTPYVVYAGSCNSDSLVTSPASVPAGGSVSASLLLPALSLVALTSPQTSNTTSTLGGVRFTDSGCGTSYPLVATNLVNNTSTTATATESEPLPSGTYGVCAQWLVAHTGTTTSLSTSTSKSTTSNTSTSVSTSSDWNWPGGWTTHTSTVTNTSTTVYTSTSTTTVTNTTTSTSTSAAATSSVTNTTSAASTPTLSEAVATSGTC